MKKTKDILLEVIPSSYVELRTFIKEHKRGREAELLITPYDVIYLGSEIVTIEQLIDSYIADDMEFMLTPNIESKIVAAALSLWEERVEEAKRFARFADNPTDYKKLANRLLHENRTLKAELAETKAALNESRGKCVTLERLNDKLDVKCAELQRELNAKRVHSNYEGIMQTTEMKPLLEIMTRVFCR